MRIIFIRHGDPDYKNDTLTEKGWREAKLLAERVCKWPVKEFYCSPLGRAKDTASCSLEKMNRKATIYEWLQEFKYPITDPTTGRYGVPWDFMPSYWTNEPLFYDKEHWHETSVYQQNGDIRVKYDEVCRGIDGILSAYGYIREKNIYRTEVPPAEGIPEGKPYSHCDDTIVIFCHLGVACVMLSHLLGIAPTLLWQNFFLAPTSVTILASEERMPGTAYFRVQAMGDTTHLHDGNEPVSHTGYFAEPFQL